MGEGRRGEIGRVFADIPGLKGGGGGGQCWKGIAQEMDGGGEGGARDTRQCGKGIASEGKGSEGETEGGVKGI